MKKQLIAAGIVAPLIAFGATAPQITKASTAVLPVASGFQPGNLVIAKIRAKASCIVIGAANDALNLMARTNDDKLAQSFDK